MTTLRNTWTDLQDDEIEVIEVDILPRGAVYMGGHDNLTFWSGLDGNIYILRI